MRGLWLSLLLMVSAAPGVGASPYEVQTVISAQEALTRLGFDVGDADGHWGAKTRGALNELRANYGLPPADEFTGSSLALIHNLSPGATTLPNPGFMIGDPVQRREFLRSEQNKYINTPKWCPENVDEVDSLSELLERKPVAKVETVATPNGYITRGDDWYTPIMQTLIGAHNFCLGGKESSCKGIVSLLSRWAEADALQPSAKRTSKRWDDTSWIANSLLRNFIFAYADARKLTPVDPVKDAAVLDWLMKRVDEYHYNIPSGNEGEVSYTEASNHALANMMPAMVFGSLVGDRSMMEDAFDSWRVAMAYMRDDGSLPTETRRGARALQYSSTLISTLHS